MNRYLKSLHLPASLAVLTLVLCSTGCGPSGGYCSEDPKMYIHTNTVQDQAKTTLAVFYFKQSYYGPKPGTEDCYVRSEVTLRIENYISQMLSFPYRVLMSLKDDRYSFDGVAHLTIEPRIQEQGMVSTVPIRMDLADVNVILTDFAQMR